MANPSRTVATLTAWLTLSARNCRCQDVPWTHRYPHVHESIALNVLQVRTVASWATLGLTRSTLRFLNPSPRIVDVPDDVLVSGLSN
jgi:hypothetical protein